MSNLLQVQNPFACLICPYLHYIATLSSENLPNFKFADTNLNQEQFPLWGRGGVNPGVHRCVQIASSFSSLVVQLRRMLTINLLSVSKVGVQRVTRLIW